MLILDLFSSFLFSSSFFCFESFHMKYLHFLHDSIKEILPNGFIFVLVLAASICGSNRAFSTNQSPSYGVRREQKGERGEDRRRREG